jgi:two-component system nitrogen regulation sensor histidine kinase NtrY
MTPVHWKASFESRVLLYGLAGGLPAVAVAMGFLGRALSTPRTWALATIIVGSWLVGSMALRGSVARRLQTVSNLLAALRDGDFSIRARGAGHGDSLSEALFEINSLAETLAHEQRGALEATALLGKVIAEIDAAIFAFDAHRRLRLVNRAGERLLARPKAHLLDKSAAELGLAELLAGPAERTLSATFARADGQWEVRRGAFRQGGMPHELVVFTDLQRALREEERQAWQRLVRVLGHEINNSLAPIHSIAHQLNEMLGREERSPHWQQDLARGISVIERRSQALGRFMTSYAQLAKLPPPALAPVDVGEWVQRVVELETRIAVRVTPGPSALIRGDGDQLDQLLINLVRNGVDAAAETGGSVDLTWRRVAGAVELVVADGGAGLGSTQNLFVPFFTTKPGGSGIGLVLSRQIAEAHRGALTLQNRRDKPGCEARLRLPL